MAREGIHYLVEYDINNDEDVFIPLNTDKHEFICKFYPHISTEYTLTQQGPIEDGEWVKIVKTGYEDIHVFLPLGDTINMHWTDIERVFIFFFSDRTNFMKKKPQR